MDITTTNLIMTIAPTVAHTAMSVTLLLTGAASLKYKIVKNMDEIALTE